jgi:hypothetical protein
MPSTSPAVLRSIAACALLVAACAPAPPIPTPIAATASLPTWGWVQADVQDPSPSCEIDNLWTLSSAGVAACTDQTDEDGGVSTLFVSADGVGWQLAPFPEDGFLVEHGTVVDGELTIIGNIGPVEDPRRQVWTTGDGRKWTRLDGVDGLAFGPGHVQALVHSDVGWLADGVEVADPETQRRHVLQSPDRITWTEVGGPVTDRGFASDGHRIVAPGIGLSDTFPFAHTVAWSDDARSWTGATVAMLGQFESGDVIGATPRGFALGGQRFKVGDESSHPIGWWSTDGETWQESTFDVLDGPAGEAAPREINGTDDGLIARGNGDPLQNAIWISDDGRAWQQVTPLPPGYVSAFARDGDAVLLAIQPASGDGVLWRGTATP